LRNRKVPDERIQRLPSYLRAMRSVSEQGRTCICSGGLAEILHARPPQIRKDWSYFGSFGTPGNGYEVVENVSDLCTLKKRRIRLGIMAVPSAAAQEVGEELARAGVLGILSFAASPVSVPKSVKVISVDIAASLACLPYHFVSMTSDYGEIHEESN
jgi:NADH/NAD ratio-sensing transcriptional regulator Rex